MPNENRADVPVSCWCRVVTKVPQKRHHGAVTERESEDRPSKLTWGVSQARPLREAEADRVLRYNTRTKIGGEAGKDGLVRQATRSEAVAAVYQCRRTSTTGSSFEVVHADGPTPPLPRPTAFVIVHRRTSLELRLVLSRFHVLATSVHLVDIQGDELAA